MKPSPPAWGCGLKQMDQDAALAKLEITPRVGVRIETGSVSTVRAGP